MQKFNYTRHNRDETILAFLSHRFPYLSSSEWVKAITSGAIQVNMKQITPDYVLINRDIVCYERPRSAEPDIDETYNILYLDESIVVVEKNGNIPVAESGKYYRNTLINILKEQEKYPTLHAVHRLDKETSGVIVIARNKTTATILGKQFSQQIPKKEYHAVLIGEFNKNEILIDRPLKKNIPLPGRVRIRQIISPTGKQSKTLFTAEKTSNGLTRARVKLFTGRTHQIRCHAEYIGYPILGDKLYGQTDQRFLELLKGESDPIFPPYGRLDRQLLHASKLSFNHPVSGEEMTFYSDYKAFFEIFQSVHGVL